MEFIKQYRTCKHCKKVFISILDLQTPGCRDTEEEICPYCHEVNRKSMTVNFHTEPAEDLSDG